MRYTHLPLAFSFKILRGHGNTHMRQRTNPYFQMPFCLCDVYKLCICRFAIYRVTC